MRLPTLALRRGRLRTRSIVQIVAAVAIAAAVLLGIVWPEVSRTLVDWTGEEDLAHQLKGATDLVRIRLTEPSPDLAPYTPMPYVDENPYGVSTFLEQEADEANVRRSLEMIKAAGFGWIRQQFPWEDIEIHGKGDFEDRRTQPYKSAWLKYDRIVDLANQYGIQILARLDVPPQWSRADRSEDGTFAPPDNLNDYGDFVEAVMRRYKGRVRVLQIWNEPNIYPEWGNRKPDPEGYVALLKIAYQRAKAVDPHVVVLSAPLAPTLDRTDRALRDLDYLDRMYTAGAKNSFDILGAIAYGLGTGPTNRRVDWSRTNFSRVELLRDIMVRHGDAGKPMWIVEMGWNVVPQGMPAPFGRVTEARQAHYSVVAFDRIVNDWPFVGAGFIWYFRRPNPDWEQRPEGYFRLVSPDWKPLPVYNALKEMMSRPPVLPPGYHYPSHPALRWGGNWQALNDAATGVQTGTRAVSADAELRFSFYGTDLDLVVPPGQRPAAASVEGEAVPLASTPAEGGQSLIHLARSLPDDLHSVHIRAGSGLTIEGLIVRQAPDLWSLRTPLVYLGLVVATLAVVAWLLRRALADAA